MRLAAAVAACLLFVASAASADTYDDRWGQCRQNYRFPTRSNPQSWAVGFEHCQKIADALGRPGCSEHLLTQKPAIPEECRQ